jgi:hypothetical protein
VLLQRVHSGLCYMHAPMMLQHYLVCKYKQGNCSHEILDLARFTIETLSSSHLKRNIFNEREAVRSRDFLHHIVQEGTVAQSVSYDIIDSSLLKRYGPLLVPNFMVTDGFCSNGRLVHTGYAGNGDLGSHAMLLIGVRMEAGSPRFLLQNWWRHCQFVEVDTDYMQSSLTLPYLVTTPQTFVPAGFAQEARLYGETADLDRGELAFEGGPVGYHDARWGGRGKPDRGSGRKPNSTR